MSSSFVNRTISGALLLAITIACIYFKGIPLVLYSFFVTILSFYEILKVLSLGNRNLIFGVSVVFIGFTLYAISVQNLKYTLFSILVYSLLNFSIYLFDSDLTIKFPVSLIFSYVYIVIPMGIFLNLGYTGALWFVFMISWGTDTFAYLFGLAFGKHKLYPTVSPKKTIEGSIGGVFGAMLMCLIVNSLLFKFDIKFIIPLAILGSIFAQVGDLFASRIKREFNIKDFGNLIAGHGGILDRYDSILFVTPIVYIAFNIFGGI